MRPAKNPHFSRKGRARNGAPGLSRFSISDNTGCLDFAGDNDCDAAGAGGLRRINRLDELCERRVAGCFQNNDSPGAIVKELGQTALQR